MELLVVVFLVVLFAILRSQLSMDRPGKLRRSLLCHALTLVVTILDATVSGTNRRHARSYSAI